MKRAGRKRRAAGWTLLALGLLVAGVWVASGWVTAKHHILDCTLRIYSGNIHTTTTFLITCGNAMEVQAQFPIPSFEWDLATSPRWTFEAVWPAPEPFQTSTRKFGLVLNQEVTMPGFNRPNYIHWTVAFWPIPLLLWTPAALLLRSGIIARRRAITDKCKKCGYDLAGLPAGSPCPECGKANTGHG